VRLIVGISGASGAIYGVRALQALRELGVETHLVVTNAGLATMRLETDFKRADVVRLASETHEVDDITSKIASGSYQTDGMLIIPCSMKTLAGIAGGYSDNLLLRAADVTIKERRRLVLVVRETPLSLIHIENMAKVTRAGAIVLPAMPAFYQRPKTVAALVDQVVGKALDMLEIEHHLLKRWEGRGEERHRSQARASSRTPKSRRPP